MIRLLLNQNSRQVSAKEQTNEKERVSAVIHLLLFVFMSILIFYKEHTVSAYIDD